MQTGKLIDHLLKHVSIDKREAEIILSSFTTRHFKKKDLLLRAGEICRVESFVVRGCFRTFTIDENGYDRTLVFSVEDWWTGDMLSFLTAKPSMYSIEALEDAEILQISKERLEKLYLEVPKLERYFRLLVQNAYISQLERINTGLSQTAEQRYLLFLENYPGFAQRIPQKYIASFLGITPEFLSMLRRKLSRR